MDVFIMNRCKLMLILNFVYATRTTWYGSDPLTGAPTENQFDVVWCLEV